MSHLKIYNDVKFSNFNANNISNNFTDWVDVRTCDVLTWYITHVTGVHTTHVIEMQTSPNGATVSKENDDDDIIGLGSKTIDCSGLSYIRWKCITAQGAVSLVDIWVRPFRKR